MKTVTTIEEIRSQVKLWREAGLSIGFVPTMGFLHEGHKSLMEKSVKENDKTIVSIFVNPTQFGEGEDFDSYPRDLEKDQKVCESACVDLIFHPGKEEMYPDGFCSFVDMNGLTKGLCGKTRPIHFRGVCTVVSKLFHITEADRAYFGQKDAQQLAVIKQMVRDLNMKIEVIGCPIIREEDGLAKSSRNTYLNEEEKKAALVLSRAVNRGLELVKNGETNTKKIVDEMKELIALEPLAKIDYVEAVDGITMEPVDSLTSPTLVAMAVYIGKTRLIDNFIVD